MTQQNNTKLFLATPMYGAKCYSGFLHSALKLNNYMRDNNIEFHIETITNESLITRARTKLVDAFLASDYTHLLFIDADEEFEPYQIHQLINYDVGIVCGLVAKKTINWQNVLNVVKQNPNIQQYEISNAISEYCVNWFGMQDYEQKPQINGLIPVRHSGTGCMLINRQVFDLIKPNMPTYLDYGSAGTEQPIEKTLWFDTGIEEPSKLYLSEDYWFCNKYNEVGGVIYVAPSVRLKHVGNYTYG